MGLAALAQRAVLRKSSTHQRRSKYAFAVNAVRLLDGRPTQQRRQIIQRSRVSLTCKHFFLSMHRDSGKKARRKREGAKLRTGEAASPALRATRALSVSLGGESCVLQASLET